MGTLVFTVFTSLIAGVIGWWGSHFAGKDVVDFRSLRREIREGLDFTANVYQREGDEERYDHAQKTLRTLATRLKALHETTNKAVLWYFQRNGYDLGTAATGLMALSDSMGRSGYGRMMQRYRVEKGLKFMLTYSKDSIEETRDVELARDR